MFMGDDVLKRRLIALFAIMCLVLTNHSAWAQGNAQATLQDVTVMQGESVEVTVQLTDNPGLAAWVFEIIWDLESFSLEADPEVGDAFSSGTLLSNHTDGSLVVSWFSVRNVSNDGIMFRFRLKAIGEAGEYPIVINCSSENTINVKGERMPVGTVNGAITITGSDNDENSGANDDTQKPAPSPDDQPADGGETQRPGDGDSTSDQKENPFTDVQRGLYYHDPVLWAVERGVTTGTSKTTFSPEMICTRAQMVTFLWRAAGSPEPATVDQKFTDITSSGFYFKAVLWAVENGITSGTSATTFSPDEIVTRAQVVTFLWRMAGSPQIFVDGPFADVATGQYYSTAVAWAVENSITGGTSAVTFSPMDGCTRGQIVTFLYRYYQ